MVYLLHHLLRESASRSPSAVAVKWSDQSLTYAELDTRSNQLAQGLVAMGVRRGDRVALHVRKSPAAIVSLFAVLKAGACYVPVDSSAPAGRLADIVQQCSVRCLITSSEFGRKLAEFPPNSPLRQVLFTDRVDERELHFTCERLTLGSAAENQQTISPDIPAIDQDLAYILFTSGSTGTPKGVMLSHLNALTFVNWATTTFHLNGDDCLSSHAPLNFDLSVFDVFGGIKAGASISLVPEGLSAFPVRLSTFVEGQGITVWYSVPSALILMLTRGRLDERDLRRLRLVLFAGEVFPAKYLSQLMQVVPNARFFNLYGPTETNVCTYYEVDTAPQGDAPPIPIGRSCTNTECLVIDESGRPVEEPNQEGVLYVRGSTVMQGYYGRPVDTDNAFITNRFSEGREERLYCTGDWVTVDDLGNYRFIGRRDHMIKTRGYRVELGEVETALYAHPAVHEVAAVALPDDLLGNTIKVYVVTDDSTLDEAEIKRYCSQRLPSYMVPETVEFREILPRTATDKLDRARLAEDSRSRHSAIQTS